MALNLLLLILEPFHKLVVYCVLGVRLVELCVRVMRFIPELMYWVYECFWDAFGIRLYEIFFRSPASQIDLIEISEYLVRMRLDEMQRVLRSICNLLYGRRRRRIHIVAGPGRLSAVSRSLTSRGNSRCLGL